VQRANEVGYVEALQGLVGVAVRHWLWGAGRIAAVRGTTAATFPGGVVIVVDFAARSGAGSPFTVADLWGGERFARPTLPATLAGVGQLLDALLAESRRPLPPAPVAATAPPTIEPRFARLAAQGAARQPAAPPANVGTASAWARSLLTRDDWVIVDTETTGLDSGAEVIDLAVLDRHGTILLETLLRPRRPIPAQVTRIHGLGDHHVRDAPTFAQIWPRLGPILAGRTIIAYNVAFDKRLLAQTATTHGVAMPTLNHECAMRRYVAYRTAKGLPGGRGSYSLEKACRDHGIPIGGHRAASDCCATLALMRVMAR
jgi:DNA polymerase-3 subunit epsilon